MVHPWPRIALATCEAQRNLASEDRLLLCHLEKMGFSTYPLVWTRDDNCRDALVVIRSCWDYHLRPARFLEWSETVDRKGGRLLNSPQTIRWNHDKRYLRELQASGVRVTPTLWIETGANTTLRQIVDDTCWTEIVVKPSISATAWRTFRSSRQAIHDLESSFHDMVQSGCVLVQEFVGDVLTRGEWSFVFFNGVYSHAVLKRPSQFDFRVQHEFGGIVDRQAQPDPCLIDEALHALHQCPGATPLYARVDGIQTGDGLIIMEIELIEPALFLDFDDMAAARFARAIAARADDSIIRRGCA